MDSLRNALELPNKYKNDPERLLLTIISARMHIIAKIWYSSLFNPTVMIKTLVNKIHMTLQTEIPP